MKFTLAAISFVFLTVSHCLPVSKRDQTSPGGCNNVYSECPEWKDNGLCEQNREYMAITCPVTCGLCEEGNLKEDDGENQEVFSGEVDDDGSGSARQPKEDNFSGNQRTYKDNKERQSNQGENSNKEKPQKGEQKPAEQEKTENAEKYEDEEKGSKVSEKQVQERSRAGHKDLMETMMKNKKLMAIAVNKGKARNGVPSSSSEELGGESEELEDSTNVDLDLKEAGLEAYSGSGETDGKLHLTLRQTFNKNYDDKNSPAYKILSGNFEKDMVAALGDDNDISDIGFSEAEVEGNPKTTGKVQVNFKFRGNYDKLNKIIKSGTINGLLVLKNSLEGPMLNLNEN